MVGWEGHHLEDLVFADHIVTAEVVKGSSSIDKFLHVEEFVGEVVHSLGVLASLLDSAKIGSVDGFWIPFVRADREVRIASISLDLALDWLGRPDVFLAVKAEEVASGLDLILFDVALGLALGLHVWEVRWGEKIGEVVAWKIFFEVDSAGRSLGTDASKGD